MNNPTKRRKFLTVATSTLASMGLTYTVFGSNFKDQNSGYLGENNNVKNFGAKGDGQTDDSQAIQRAIIEGKNGLFFPKGHYKISETIEMDLDKLGYGSIRGEGTAQIIMTGSGPAFKIKGTHFQSADPQNFDPRVWSSERMPIVEGLSIEGQHEMAVGIEAVGTMQLAITRVQIRKTLHAIHLTGNNRNLIISDCHFYENHGIGIFYDEVNLHQSNITACHISYNDGGGIVTKGGNIRNIHITGCDLESNMGKNNPPAANVLIDCSDSEGGTAEVAITGCTIQHNRNAPHSANIRILGKSKVPGTNSKQPWGNVTITGNVLSDVMVNIDLQQCRGVVITGNTIWQGYDHGLVMDGCSHVLLGANLFDSNPNYTPGRTASNGLLVHNCEDCTFSGVQVFGVKDVAGINIRHSKRMNIGNCTILDCDNIGLSLENVSHSRVSGCLISNEQEGEAFIPVKISGGEGNVILE
ncbi:MAG: right-handed parallel beta-helix repeat-containing protein [Cyclobacteriaceae bacterium]